MSDNPEQPQVEEPQVEESPSVTPEAPVITAQEAKTVGDENLTTREPDYVVVQDQVDAQVVQPREGDHDKVNVHEVHVQLDEVITDPASPLAVQVPDAGRGSLDLPIHSLAGQTVEQVFAEKASEPDDES